MQFQLLFTEYMRVILRTIYTIFGAESPTEREVNTSMLGMRKHKKAAPKKRTAAKKKKTVKRAVKRTVKKKTVKRAVKRTVKRKVAKKRK